MKAKKQNQVNPTEGIDTPKEKPKKKHRVLNTVVNVVLVVALVIAAVCTYISFVSASGNGVPSVLGVEFFSIQTDSMSPTLQPGDLAICKVVKDPSELRTQDVITYWTVINGERVLNTHRIEAIYDGGNYLIFQTKGDNNNSADPMTVHQSEVVGKWTGMRLSGVGKVLDYLQTSTGFLIVIVIPVFLFFLFHLVQFFRVLFEYQNVKNRLKYEEERGRTEDMLEDRKREQDEARAEMEAKLREKLKAELLADMAKQAAAAQQAPAQEAPAQEAPAQETPAEEAPAEEAPAEEAPAEEAPAQETPAEEAPAEEAPAQEAPTEEAPTEETEEK